MAKEKAIATFKIGNDEIRYEASREAVEAQMEKVLDRLLDRGATVSQVSVSATDPSASGSGGTTPSTVPAFSAETTTASIEPNLVEKLYSLDADGRLVMSRVPNAPADVLLLVLYGMTKVQDAKWASSPTLTKTARAAGAHFERGDRLLSKRPALIQTTGVARGKSYRLTTKGEEHCRRLIRGLFPAERKAPR